MRSESRTPRPVPALPAPAVDAAVRILDYLAKVAPRAGVTEIARALGINKSTCYNILLTLAHSGIVAKLPGVAQYQLGPRLAELGGAQRRQYGYRDLIRQRFEPIVAETGVVGVIGQLLGDDSSYVIIDQIAPSGRRSRHPAPPVGSVFPLTGPALGRALLACFPDDAAMRIVEGLAPRAKAEELATWRRQLAAVRKSGYAVSREEYAPDVNAVAAPIKHAGVAYLVAALIGDPRALPERRLDEIGKRLARSAAELARELPGELRLVVGHTESP